MTATLKGLVEGNCHRDIVVIGGFHGGLTHLLALTTTSGRLDFGILTVMFPKTDIHILLNFAHVLQDITQHTLFDRPSEEIQLAHRCLLNRGRTADLKTDALTTTKRIKQTLAIRFELAFVMEMHHELTLFMDVIHIELLGIVRYEPVDETETDRRRTRQNRQNLLQGPRLIVEILQPTNDEILFALNAVFQSLTLRSWRFHLVSLDILLGLDRRGEINTRK